MRLFRKSGPRDVKPERPARPPIPALEWAKDISGKYARITAVGNRRLLVENHTGILDFSSACISLNTASGPILINGCGLYLANVRRGALMVVGEIRQVQLPCKGGTADEG